MTGVIDFSIDATSNGTGAPPINFAEGQPAGTVNNSARALMAALACWRDDLSGLLIANGGAANALTLSTRQTVTTNSLKNGLSVAFRIDAANTASATLNIDGTGAKPLRRASYLELAPGDLSRNTVHRVVYLDGPDLYLLVSPSIEAPGRIAAFGSVAAIPSGWLRCDGAAVSRTTYAALFDAIGTAHGAGNGSTTFNLPDLDGRTVFGADNGKGRISAAGGLAGAIGSVGGTQTTTLTVAQMPSHGHTGTAASGGGVAAGTTGSAGGHDHGGATDSGGSHAHTGSTQGAGGHGHTGSAQTGGEHAHTLAYTQRNNARFSESEGDGPAVTYIGAGPSALSSASTNLGGSHSHGLTIDAVGDHTHTLTINATGNHTHALTAAGNHTHTTPAIPAHTHDVTIAANGSGEAHPNMPPGLVAVWAIKA